MHAYTTFVLHFNLYDELLTRVMLETVFDSQKQNSVLHIAHIASDTRTATLA